MTASEPLNVQLGQWQMRALMVGIAFSLLAIVGAILGWQQFLRSYLFGFLIWMGMGLGCLAILLLHHTVGGKWGMMIRRMCEAGARTLPYMLLLLIPILVSLPTLYSWARPEALQDVIIKQKAAYLNQPGVIGRTIFYFLVWAFYGYKLSRLSADQDATGDTGLVSRMRAISAPGLVVFTFVTTFAFIDWVMSLEPDWFSTIYGAMFLIGQVLESFAFVIALVIILSTPQSDQGLRHQAASTRSGQHDVRVHGVVGLPFVFAVPDYVGGQSARRNHVVFAPLPGRLGMGGVVAGDFSLRDALRLAADARDQAERAKITRRLRTAAGGPHGGRLLDCGAGILRPANAYSLDGFRHAAGCRWPMAVFVLLAVEIEAATPAARSAAFGSAPRNGSVLSMESNPNIATIEAGHESKDANVRFIVLVLLGLGISVAIVAAMVYGIFWYLADHPLNTARANPLVESVQIPPPPRIDVHPGAELKDLHNYEDEILSTYGWTDPKKGIVRIPIDQAMQLEMEKGFPTQPSNQSGAAHTATGVAK